MRMNNRTHSALARILGLTRQATTCILLLVGITIGNVALATDHGDNAGIIDGPSANVAGMSQRELKKQVKQEQKALRKASRQELNALAKQGERLAQVELGSDFAEEAQMLTFAPAAANDALSDALRWYSIAAQRGYPGALSLDRSGVSFYPVRVVRNR